MMISKLRTIYPQHPELFIDHVVLTNSNSSKILGVDFWTTYTWYLFDFSEDLYIEEVF